MKKLLLLIPTILLLFACAAPPEGAEEPADADALREVESVTTVPQVGDSVNGPVATAVIVIGGESTDESEVSDLEGYPEPEVVEEPASYPEPEVEEVVEEAVEASETAFDLSTMLGEGDVDVVFVSARANGGDSWNFAVTLEHEDTGWEDYADGWDVILPDGTVLKPNADSPFTRLLLHPHENEQPFTRNQNGILIPADVTTVYVRGHELVEGYSSMMVEVDLTAESGDRFEVVR